jgi:hypothetical protein
LFTETSNDNVLFGDSDVLVALSNAERVVFLGFGFHSMNTRLLRVDPDYRHRRMTPVSTKIIGTSKGMSVSSKNSVIETLSKNLASSEIELFDSTCAELLASERGWLEDDN